MTRVTLDNAELTSNSPDALPARTWGWVSARPSEYLIVYRKGKVAEALCGQGGRFFRWPSDTYVLIPTTLKEVVFKANQVTVDFVDLKVRGMVVYRIVDPHRVYKLINFSDRPAAEAKLAQMISDLCRSLAKWLVANLRLEECMRRRKEEIAGTLAREVGTIATDRWGVEIVTIDVQDVFIQDETLFRSMQAGFLAEKEREAQLAALESERSVAARRLAHERAQEQERQELELARIELARARAERQFTLDQERGERDFALARARAEQAEAQARLQAEGRRERARIVAEARQIRADEQLRAYRERLAAESGAGPASLERLFMTEALPALSQALAKGLEGARMHVFQTGEGGAGLVPMVIDQVLAIMRDRKKA